jgi:Ca-activated chloride channel homolog
MVVWALLTSGPDSYAESTAGAVDKGNAAYHAGKYDDALAAYDDASVKDPESPYIYFNRGAAFYQKGDYAKAGEAFEKAALKSKDIRLEAESKFNLGNCAYREAERQQDSDLNKALEECGKGIRHYQEALGLDPDFHEAAENIEVVRLVMKNIFDQINKQKEAQKQQQEAANKARETLEELIKRQQDAINQNKLIEEQRAQGETQDVLDKLKELTKDQKDIQTDTEKLAEDMSKTRGKDDKKTPAETHLDNAVKEEQAASGNLEQKNTQAAMTNQEKALKELQDALSPPDDGKKSGENQQQDKGKGPEQKKPEEQQGQKQQGQDQQGQQQPKPSGQEPQKQEGKEEGVKQASDDAKDILDEEKENKTQRQLQNEGGYRDVDKDW